uniref:OTU domain-containing protein n=1 Tax=Polytomella parva TaxID=51329 RepID=A0A7S0YHA4_9CHLO|mmetsp:Transcript_1971/g.2934  ORF Transcript_1971/g.2934 Transcript_1971/m.2934 type:complete len:462 (+) Transcript_1971:463-1848(+)|eukprot:CAMPEP_0175081846 /NCGR_PEP_ID=MMETSP0052_2-20121109/26400_1 /TAXON_ID=51329 ORGANISM="Polytomella parva, Strain SAG 63-3" /NCGR_SAMPLE_ID=MMETSP0052_2 /ASSEMBLY_ACC=CAM_ASM_000194 /LENGTH=461 /DNA_ID=CAMNT_0016352923 /DNA_START=410 /DNA_END=1795 /DNA_ORIENTATION=-
MREFRHLYEPFLEMDEEGDGRKGPAAFDFYLDQMSRRGSWAGHMEVVAAARHLRRTIIVHHAGCPPITISPEFDSEPPPPSSSGEGEGGKKEETEKEKKKRLVKERLAAKRLVKGHGKEKEEVVANVDDANGQFITEERKGRVSEGGEKSGENEGKNGENEGGKGEDEGANEERGKEKGEDGEEKGENNKIETTMGKKISAKEAVKKRSSEEGEMNRSAGEDSETKMEKKGESESKMNGATNTSKCYRNANNPSSKKNKNIPSSSNPDSEESGENLPPLQLAYTAANLHYSSIRKLKAPIMMGEGRERGGREDDDDEGIDEDSSDEDRDAEGEREEEGHGDDSESSDQDSEESEDDEEDDGRGKYKGEANGKQMVENGKSSGKGRREAAVAAAMVGYNRGAKKRGKAAKGAQESMSAASSSASSTLDPKAAVHRAKELSKVAKRQEKEKRKMARDLDKKAS